MLTKKDKREIREIIQEELKTALFRKITIERGPRKQGDPEKAIKEEDWNILDVIGDNPNSPCTPQGPCAKSTAGR